jgi:plasmid stabilization system protein ParE
MSRSRTKRLEWSHVALLELAEGLAFIAEDNWTAAKLVKQRIDVAARRIAREPTVYRPGLIVGTRECVVGRTSYTLIFEVHEESIVLLHCWHQRRRLNP